MATDENLMSRGCSMASKCSLYNANVESSDHLFLACPFSIIIWQLSCSCCCSVFGFLFNVYPTHPPLNEEWSRPQSYNHAANVGGYVVDGRREFLASGVEGSSSALICAAGNCHKNFHKKE
ncbi:putative transcription factor ZF-HD family [Lupinus albus]|uniref:Putative transcription factor ZF-HD family n=1 Tax=Lupinus albus TaxID=3870 RepID=A0A6A4NNQ7_LUPAL|nr:putative transcription factor ZF-HD family [Lupinus albus]